MVVVVIVVSKWFKEWTRARGERKNNALFRNSCSLREDTRQTNKQTHLESVVGELLVLLAR